MVHVALVVVDADRVQHLLHAGHAQRRHRQHLCLAPLEEPGAVGGRDQAHPGRELTQVGRASAVDPDSLVDDAGADDLLLERAVGPPDGGLREGPGSFGRARQPGHDLGLDLVEAGVAL